MDLENNLLTEPVIFCPSILIDENIKDELKQYLTSKYLNYKSQYR